MSFLIYFIYSFFSFFTFLFFHLFIPFRIYLFKFVLFITFSQIIQTKEFAYSNILTEESEFGSKDFSENSFIFSEMTDSGITISVKNLTEAKKLKEVFFSFPFFSFILFNINLFIT